MKRFTLIADDRTVYVDGDPRVLDADAVIPENIHAIQWYGTWGEIEFKPDDRGNKPENERFFDPARFQEWFDGHVAAVERDAKKRAAEAEAAAKRDREMQELAAEQAKEMAGEQQKG